MYVVTCLDDEGKRDLATSKRFDSRHKADTYADSIAKSREPLTHTVCPFCLTDWRTYQSWDTERCVNCDAA